ncbi:hypothetical protein [Actinophytocola sp. NPDC049390]|uniref:hypothetical protein n=1 Tax=Actinophytocola sp. NPDC049390 TaxID=3363894 RepID=UPI0037B49FC9
MTGSTGKRRICRGCLINSLAGVAWQMWGARQGWPRLTRCRRCAPPRADRPAA